MNEISRLNVKNPTTRPAAPMQLVALTLTEINTLLRLIEDQEISEKEEKILFKVRGQLIRKKKMLKAG